MNDSRLEDWKRQVAQKERIVRNPAAPIKAAATRSASTGASSPGAAPVSEAKMLRRMPAAKSWEECPGTVSQQRMRVRPETRAEMIERLTNPTITLHEASVILGVCRTSVRKYCESGLLPHERTPGGQRRFRLKAVVALYKELERKRIGMAMPRA